MAKKIGCTALTITRKAEKLGLPKIESTHWTKAEDEFLKNNANIMTANQIAEALGRTELAVYSRASKLKIPLDAYWTEEQEKSLKELWGTVSIETIAKNLHRTITAIEVKARKMKLGPAFEANGEYLRLSDISRELNVDINRVRYTWIKKGMKYHNIKITNKTHIMGVKIEDLFEFLEYNQADFDARYLEENILGKEPNWLKEKRKRDFQNPPPEYRLWTTNEEQILRSMLAKGKKYEEIGDKINRSRSAVANKIIKLNLTLPNFWTSEEHDFLRENYEAGFIMSYSELAQELGRSKTSVAKRCRTLGYNLK